MQHWCHSSTFFQKKLGPFMTWATDVCFAWVPSTPAEDIILSQLLPPLSPPLSHSTLSDNVLCSKTYLNAFPFIFRGKEDKTVMSVYPRWKAFPVYSCIYLAHRRLLCLSFVFFPGCSVCHQGISQAVDHSVWVLWKLNWSHLVQTRGVALSAAERMWHVFITTECNSDPHPVPISKDGKWAGLPNRAYRKNNHADK